MNREEFKKELSSQKKTQLRHLYIMSKIVGGKSVEDLGNFPKASGVINCIRDTGAYLKVSSHVVETK